MSVGICIWSTYSNCDSFKLLAWSEYFMGDYVFHYTCSRFYYQCSRGKIYSLDDKGAILTEKVAKLLEINVGDKLTIDTDDGEKTVLISAICENYMGHYLYMTSEVYEKTFGEAAAYESSD